MSPVLLVVPLLAHLGPQLAGVGAIDTSDCELVGGVFPTQPVGTWSSLAFVVAGCWFLGPARRAGVERPLATAAAWLLVLAGVGSVAYHGLGGETARWLHDASFLWLIGFLAACTGLARPSPLFGQVVVFGAASIGAATALPVATNVLLAVLAGLVTWAEVVRWPARADRERRALGVAGGVALAAGAVYLAGRTGSPLCAPESTVQLHGMWHVLSALALVAWSRVVFGVPPRGAVPIP